MTLQQYKELLLNQDIRQFEKELKLLELINNWDKANDKFLPENVKEGEVTGNEIEIEGIGKVNFKLYTPKKGERFGRTLYILETPSEYKRFSNMFILLKYKFLPLIKSIDSYAIESYSGRLSYSKETYIEKLNKKWDKYFEKLQKQLESICGEELQEVFLNNYSDDFKQSDATVFGGNKGKAILWTTLSGGYNIQSLHKRLFCKELTKSHIKKFGIIFN